MPTKCPHGLYPQTEYCDPCQREAHDAFTTWAARLSHDATPMIPSHN